jgi:uncharacterized RDD family membrane protein YckC
MADEILIIETPEHVELQFGLATIGNRFLACMIDHVIQFTAMFVTYFIARSLSGSVRELEQAVIGGDKGANLWVIALWMLVSFVIFFGYFIFFETIWNGQTPGKRWMKLRVIQEDGRPIHFFASLSRNLIRLADSMPFPFYSVGLLSVFASDRARRLGDFVAGTVVIKERSAEAPTFEEVFESEEIDTALRRVAPAVEFQGDLRAVAQADVLVVENFLRRRYDIPEHPRRWLAWRIAVPLMEKIRPAFDPAAFNYEGFLEEVLARHRVQVKPRD